MRGDNQQIAVRSSFLASTQQFFESWIKRFVLAVEGGANREGIHGVLGHVLVIIPNVSTTIIGASAGVALIIDVPADNPARLIIATRLATGLAA